jgi:hypothetical protein
MKTNWTIAAALTIAAFGIGCDGGRGAQQRAAAMKAQMAAQEEALRAHEALAKAQAELLASRETLEVAQALSKAELAANSAKADPVAILAEWKCPGATEPATFTPNAERTSPAMQEFVSSAPFAEIWNFYAKKCGLPDDLNGISTAYKEGTEQTFGHASEAGAVVLKSQPGGNPRTGQNDTLATFTFQGKGHTITVILHARKVRENLDDPKSPEKDAGAEVTLYCTTN